MKNNSHANVSDKTLAFVIPWYGKRIPGGAESECRKTAENLARRGVKVEALTTCIGKLESNWSHNLYTEGGYLINGVTVRRFKVRPRQEQLFSQINEKLLKGDPITYEEETRYMEEMINSDSLYDFILKNKDRYYYIFIPYLFSTTYFGSAITPENSYIIPCLHDERYAYMSIMKEMFKKVKGVIFNTKEELKLAEKLYDLNKTRPLLFGVGVDANINYDSSRFREKYRIKERFILCAGRRDAGKNTPLLIDYFRKYKSENKNDLKLALIGNVPIKIPEDCRNSIIDLGYIPLQDKYDAYAAATIFCQPSVNESFSLVIMESWLCGSPVIVHGDCAVTKDHCVQSKGGLYFKDYFQFNETVNLMLNDEDLRKQMAENGKKYVIDNYNWDSICDKYINEFFGVDQKTFKSQSKKKTKKIKDSKIQIHQMLPIFSYGDAIGNNALAIQRFLRKSGFNSYIFADLVDTRLRMFHKPYAEYLDISSRNNILLYHYSLNSKLSDFIKPLPDKKIMIYHNITPESFYEEINEVVANNCRKGREALKNLSKDFNSALGDSEYNRRELEEFGYDNTNVLPIMIDFDKYNSGRLFNSRLIKHDYVKILHVGRIAPNKKIEDIIKAFYFYQNINPKSQLFLIGTNNDTKKYSNGLNKLASDLSIKELYFLNHVNSDELVEYYQRSDIYLCMSEHEGFCIPLIESMFFNLPIIAYNSTAVPHTLKDAGILINEKNYYKIAEMINLLATDKELCEKIVTGQKNRLKEFHIDNIKETLKIHLETVHGSPLSI